MNNKKEINRLRDPGTNALTKRVRIGSEKIPGGSGRNLPGNTSTQRALHDPQYVTNQQHHTLTTSRGPSMGNPENSEDPLVIPEPLDDLHEVAPHSSKPRTRPRKLPGTARLLPPRLPKQGGKSHLDKLPHDMYRDVLTRASLGHSLDAIRSVRSNPVGNRTQISFNGRQLNPITHRSNIGHTGTVPGISNNMRFLYDDPTVPQWYINSLPPHEVSGTSYRQTQYPEPSAESVRRVKRRKL